MSHSRKTFPCVWLSFWQIKLEFWIWNKYFTLLLTGICFTLYNSLWLCWQQMNLDVLYLFSRATCVTFCAPKRRWYSFRKKAKRLQWWKLKPQLSISSIFLIRSHTLVWSWHITLAVQSDALRWLGDFFFCTWQRFCSTHLSLASWIISG